MAKPRVSGGECWKPVSHSAGLVFELSYDTLKTHGGEIRVSTRDDEGTIFVIQLPEKGNI